ncbi:O-antigen ligase family protein [Corallincola luteus]|uniref:O-antigen ligase family protein n=1 Tax=Corallincola luteus TaxID=1775177 RepID=UPI0013F3B5AA|nr:O-antigen ligase family protein [Corallincola luteus]
MTTNRLAFGLLIAILVWVPIPLGSNRVWAWSVLEIMCFSLALLSLLQAWKTPGIYKAHLRHFMPLWICLSALPVMAFCQSLIGLTQLNIFNTPQEDLGRAELLALLGFSYVAFSFSVAVLVRTPKRLKILVTTLVFSAVFQSLYASTLMFTGLSSSPIFDIAITNRANGSFVYHNHLANYLALCAAMGIGLMVSQFKNASAGSIKLKVHDWLNAMTGRKMVLRLSLIVIVIALVLTRSRMGNAAFFSSLIGTGIIAMLFYKSRPKALQYFIVSIFIIDIFVVGSLVGLEKVKQRLEETNIATETRDDVVSQSLPMLFDKPFVGHGAGSFYTAFNRYQTADLGGFYDHTHNDYLQFSLEYGIPAFLLACAGVLWSFFLTIKTMRNRQSQTMKGISFGCCMAILVMIIHCAVDFNLQAAANALTFISVLTVSVVCWIMPNPRSHAR